MGPKENRPVMESSEDEDMGEEEEDEMSESDE